MRKKLYFIMLVTLLTFSSFAYASMALSVTINGDEVAFPDATPYINADGRTMVPLRFISETLDAEVSWQASTQEITIDRFGITLLLRINDSRLFVNGNAETMDTVPELVSGRTMVPLRFVSDHLGASVDWDAATQSIQITTPYLDDYTLLIYLNGTDLESSYSFEDERLYGAASEDLSEMMRIGSGAGVNVLVETGGTLAWINPNINPEKNERFYVGYKELSLLESLPRANMGEADTLSAFINWGVEAFPAKAYGLILWNHGGGPIVGYGVDEWFDGDALTLVELEEALEASIGKMGRKFDFIGFDACLMASLETANTLSPYAKYMIASQELEPGHGWDYEVVVNAITTYPPTQTENVLKAIAKGYQAQAKKQETSEDITLSVVDLRKTAAINEAAKTLFAAMTSDLTESEALARISNAVAKSKAFGGNTQEQGYTNLIDLGDFLSLLSPAYVNETASVLEALNKAVVYKIAGPLNAGASGLSLFVPYWDAYSFDESLALHARLPLSDAHLSFVEKFPKTLLEQGLLLDMANAFYVLEPDEDSPHFYLIIDELAVDWVQNVYLSVYQYLDTGRERFRSLGYDGLVIEEEPGIYSEYFDGAWTTLEGKPIALKVVTSGEDFIEYESPMLINGERMTLLAVWYFDDFYEAGGYYQILGARRGIQSATNMPDRNLIHLKEGDQIELIYTSYFFDTENYEEESGTPFKLSKDFKLSFQEIKDTHYLLKFILLDYTGTFYHSDFLDVK